MCTVCKKKEFLHHNIINHTKLETYNHPTEIIIAQYI